MTDLTGLADNSFDLVYSGQTIEHVTAEDADLTLKEIARPSTRRLPRVGHSQRAGVSPAHAGFPQP